MRHKHWLAGGQRLQDTARRCGSVAVMKKADNLIKSDHIIKCGARLSVALSRVETVHDIGRSGTSSHLAQKGRSYEPNLSQWLAGGARRSACGQIPYTKSYMVKSDMPSISPKFATSSVFIGIMLQ